MSALGQKRTCAAQKAMSALHPIATAKADLSLASCPLFPRKRTGALHSPMSAKGQKRTWYAYSKQRPYSPVRLAAPVLQQSGRRSLRWAKYFSYSAREITPPSCLTRARSLAGNEACMSSTRFQGASGVSHVERGTYSDGLVFV